MKQEIYNSQLNDKDSRRGINEDNKSRFNSGANDVKSTIGEKIENVGNKVEANSDSMLSSMGEGMNSIADSIRDNAPTKGMVGSAAGSVADGLQASGDYFSHHGVQDIAGDLTNLVRRNPVSAMWIGLGVGVLLGSALSRR